MKRILIITTTVLISGLFLSTLAFGAGQKHDTSQMESSSGGAYKVDRSPTSATEAPASTGATPATSGVKMRTETKGEGDYQVDYSPTSATSPTTAMSGEETQGITGQQLTRTQVREVQKLLNEQGFAAGPVDGIIGPKTRSAVREFQQSEDIASTGQLNEKTLRALAPNARQQELFGLSPEFSNQQSGQRSMEEHSREHEGMMNEQHRSGEAGEMKHREHDKYNHGKSY